MELDGGHISYTIRKNKRGQGYAKEALVKVLRFAREKSDLKEVLLTCKKENMISKKVIQSCGGKLEKTFFINNSYIEHYRIELI
ncbi:GNAT family N-acetyltransferase [uncultured Vagococcus sp.]|uniref:GNAT family N-acetyltransferase n=1 Tax=uncultured Vagococcus sp. TaxID=189676 RepID=UPI00258DFB44|nr:GNAT family N-acetyltransferase [uncultured Vagococcus sp.]